MTWGPETMNGLAASTEDPVLCQECGSLFGGGADAETVCPYCDGHLHPLPEARPVLRGKTTGNEDDLGRAR